VELLGLVVGSSIWELYSRIWERRSGGAGSVCGSGWTRAGGEMLKRSNGKLGSLLAVYSMQLVIILILYMEINSQHHLGEDLMQTPVSNMPLKGDWVVEGERSVGGSGG